jgi:hypothetical protein
MFYAIFYQDGTKCTYVLGGLWQDHAISSECLRPQFGIVLRQSLCPLVNRADDPIGANDDGSVSTAWDFV